MFDGGLQRDTLYTTELINAGNLKSKNMKMVIDALKHQIDYQKHVLARLKKQHHLYKKHEGEIHDHYKQVNPSKQHFNRLGYPLDGGFQQNI